MSTSVVFVPFVAVLRHFSVCVCLKGLGTDMDGHKDICGWMRMDACTSLFAVCSSSCPPRLCCCVASFSYVCVCLNGRDMNVDAHQYVHVDECI